MEGKQSRIFFSANTEIIISTSLGFGSHQFPVSTQQIYQGISPINPNLQYPPTSYPLVQNHYNQGFIEKPLLSPMRIPLRASSDTHLQDYPLSSFGTFMQPQYQQQQQQQKMLNTTQLLNFPTAQDLSVPQSNYGSDGNMPSSHPYGGAFPFGGDTFPFGGDTWCEETSSNKKFAILSLFHNFGLNI